MQNNPIFFGAFAIVIAFGLISTILLNYQKPIQKKKWSKRFSIIYAVLFGSLMEAMIFNSKNLTAVFIFGIAIIFIGYIVITKIKVCTNCGKTNQPQNLFGAPEYCSKCGNKL